MGLKYMGLKYMDQIWLIIHGTTMSISTGLTGKDVQMCRHLNRKDMQMFFERLMHRF